MGRKDAVHYMWGKGTHRVTRGVSFVADNYMLFFFDQDQHPVFRRKNFQRGVGTHSHSVTIVQNSHLHGDMSRRRMRDGSARHPCPGYSQFPHSVRFEYPRHNQPSLLALDLQHRLLRIKHDCRRYEPR